MNNDHRPVLAITPGEPAGIGPDITLALASRRIKSSMVIFADPQLLEERATELGLTVSIETIDSQQLNNEHSANNTLYVYPVIQSTPTRCASLNRNNSEYVLECLRVATDHCINGTIDALVTGPIHKGIINDSGITFSGHTEFIAEQSASYPVMMLACESFRVALATTHLPINEVASAINKKMLMQVITILENDLRKRFNIVRPRILVCGLNPHAGESGHLGREEIEIISPVLAELRDKGLNLSGPLSADTAFTKSNLKNCDAILAMYHDQGLPVIKHAGFGNTVNITLGLPFIRTSVDHGTALEIAGSGKANASSLFKAVQTAIDLTRLTQDSRAHV